jgi:hypothetical protein
MLCDSTTIAVDRDEGTGLAATAKATDASPWPPWSPGIDTQLAWAATDQVQSRDVLIASDPCPPPAGNAAGAPLTLI